MHSEGAIFLTLGVALLAGYAAYGLGARLRIPRVTVLILIGVACGPDGLDVVPKEVHAALPIIAQLALASVAYLIGEKFMSKHRRHRPAVLVSTAIIGTITTVVVAAAVAMVSGSIELGIIAGVIGATTAPANTLDVIREGRAEGPLTDNVIGVVASDDVFGIMLFSIALAMAQGLSGGGTPVVLLLDGVWDIVGATLVGFAIGLPMAWLTGRVRAGEPAILEALGFVLITAGASTLLGVSLLLACIVLGAVVARWARHHRRALHEIEGIAEPLLALFFVYAGIKLDLDGLSAIGLLGAVYLVTRVAGRVAGSQLSGLVLHLPSVVRNRLGLCLLPQAGVALGLTLLASNRLPSVGKSLVPLIAATTIAFELVGPVLTRYELEKAGEIGQRS